jgi:hypothetical protein
VNDRAGLSLGWPVLTHGSGERLYAFAPVLHLHSFACHHLAGAAAKAHQSESSGDDMQKRSASKWKRKGKPEADKLGLKSASRKSEPHLLLVYDMLITARLVPAAGVLHRRRHAFTGVGLCTAAQSQQSPRSHFLGKLLVLCFFLHLSTNSFCKCLPACACFRHPRLAADRPGDYNHSLARHLALNRGSVTRTFKITEPGEANSSSVTFAGDSEGLCNSGKLFPPRQHGQAPQVRAGVFSTILFVRLCACLLEYPNGTETTLALLCAGRRVRVRVRV